MSYSKRFSIDDAFEDELTDDIKVYGSSLGNSPLESPGAGQSKLTNYGGIDRESVTRTKKLEDVSMQINHVPILNNIRVVTFVIVPQTLSRDSDSLIYNSTTYSNKNSWCWHHPQIRENWRVVLAAIILLLFGTGDYLNAIFLHIYTLCIETNV